jgi:hypothetical protein
MLRVLLAVLLIPISVVASGSDPQLLKKKSSWSWPEQNGIVQKLHGYLESRLTGEELASAKQAAQIENLANGVGALDAILLSASQVEPSIAALKQLIDSPFAPDSSRKIEDQLSSILANGSVPAWLKTDMQLICCRYQVHHSLFDEALQRLQPLAQETSSDPATWLFCMAICQHHLLQRAPCLETLDRLLERETELPTRYAVTARLMQLDIKPLKEDSLDEISRMMNDVERRLALGRTGKTVRDKEQAIVDKLDKMIDKMEQQQQEQQKKQQQKNGGNSNGQKPQQGSQPMNDSQAAGSKGPGDVDPKNIGDGSGWGNLPPAQRLEAVQNITKDLPSHYREVIEAYFKKLATTPAQP